MVKTKREFVFATFVTSGLAVIASFVALGTQNWASANVEIGGKRSYVHFGLFTGIYERKLSTERTFELSMTCLMSENVCAMLCEGTSEGRTETLTNLFNNVVQQFACEISSRSLIYSPREDSGTERDFMNAGLWITTIVFLVLSCCAGLGATILAMWNTVYNPIEVYFNTTGLFIWNCIASVFSLFTMIMWGVMFGATLKHNICVFDTIQDSGDAISKNTALHFSYWLNLVALLLYFGSMALLGVRRYLINNEPIVRETIDDSADPGILIY